MRRQALINKDLHIIYVFFTLNLFLPWVLVDILVTKEIGTFLIS